MISKVFLNPLTLLLYLPIAIKLLIPHLPNPKLLCHLHPHNTQASKIITSKELTRTELQTRHEKGLCYNCD